MSDAIKLSDDLALYSGDLITLRADDGTFVKRFFALEGHSALLCYQKKPDDFSNFTVEIVGPNRIRLIADNENYCKRFYGWSDMSFISMDKDMPDLYSDFLVTSKGGNKITLKAENGQFLKRFFGHEGKSVITAYKSEEDPFSIFRVERGGTNCKEVLEDIQFDLTQLQTNISPLVVGKQTLVNNSPEEQTMQFSVSKTVETTKSFEWDYSFKIGVETKFKAGIPLLAENETTVKVETGFTLGGSKSDKDAQSFEASFPIKCPPNTTLQATALVTLGRVDVPYNATISRYLIDGVGNTTKYTYEAKGIFQGTNAFDLNYIINKV